MSITSDRIKQCRETKGFTKSKLSKLLGLGSQTTITNWENGTSEPSGALLVKLADVLDVAPTYLLGTTNTSIDFRGGSNENKKKAIDMASDLLDSLVGKEFCNEIKMREPNFFNIENHDYDLIHDSIYRMHPFNFEQRQLLILSSLINKEQNQEILKLLIDKLKSNYYDLVKSSQSK